jgi:hypothetical protein
MRDVSTHEVKIELGGVHVPVTLLVDDAPRTCGAILAACPLEGTVNHARLAGDEIMFPVRVEIPAENQSQGQAAGNVAYWPERMMICIFYGDTEGVGPTNVFGRVSGDLATLKEVGDTVWRKQGARMIIRAL